MISTPRRRLAAYLFVIAVMAGGLWRVETTAGRAENTADELHEIVEIDEARRCVNAWAVRRDNRDMTEASYRRNAATLLSFARDPERAAAYEAQVELDVIEIRSVLPDPDCDLEAAQLRLEDDLENG